eukprot:GHRQ01015433.1.p1 GENE.GHRQ01015433.1~~GHRQ01015433.1.p1  ORF type:complete len:102 (-),score=21.63 GHRQ01015433.1:1729-2034(-)
MAEERVGRKCGSLRVLNSYWVNQVRRAASAPQGCCACQVTRLLRSSYAARASQDDALPVEQRRGPSRLLLCLSSCTYARHVSVDCCKNTLSLQLTAAGAVA